MADEPRTSGWWQTLPGMFTAIAALILTLAGLAAALYQAGWFHADEPDPAARAVSQASAPPEAPTIAPYLKTPADGAPPAKPVNLLAAQAGGHLVGGAGSDWAGALDGKEELNPINDGLGAQSVAVFAFRNDELVVIERFTMLITGPGDRNVKQFELWVSLDSPTGPFESLGKFQTQNLKVARAPYQEFKFPPVRARYLKIRLLSSYGSPHPVVREVQVFGQMQKG